MQFLWLLFSASALATSLHPRQSSSTNYTLSPDEKTTIELLTYVRHISHTLFQTGCDGFNESDWVTAGFSAALPPNICRMANQSSAHVDTLNSILTDNGLPKLDPCTYTFEYSEPTSYISLANEILMWSISAYLGALPSLTTSPTLLTLLTSQLTILARYDGSLRSAYGTNPAPSTIDTPLPPAWSYNIAQSYISTCSHSLGYSVTPKLNVSDVPWKDNQGDPDPRGTSITISYDPTTFWAQQEEGTELFLALVNQGYDPLMVPISKLGGQGEGNVVVASAVIPAEESNGVVFAALTTFRGGLSVRDLAEFGTLAGPAEIVVS